MIVFLGRFKFRDRKTKKRYFNYKLADVAEAQAGSLTVTIRDFATEKSLPDDESLNFGDIVEPSFGVDSFNSNNMKLVGLTVKERSPYYLRVALGDLDAEELIDFEDGDELDEIPEEV